MSAPALTKTQAREVIHRYLAGERAVDIASSLGVSGPAISYYIRRWKQAGSPVLPTRRRPEMAWMDRAACSGQLNFTDLPVQTQKKVCKAGCEVKAECLEYGLAGPIGIGPGGTGTVYGGLGPKELVDLRRKQRTAVTT